ncbi:sugar fermentation stimulation protein A [Thermogladius calderae 1633]|uniref:Sugar fermentation stimulation protein A n=2 Tax=Thermogladius calderae TaxID=1200300 RepID=I3TEE7_THEC1|nr:sugar fermentation stimulation protein A [Thermogladius calderae 1633]
MRLGDLVCCSIIKRTTRFTVEVEVSGSLTTAYTNNTGRLLGYLTRGRVGYCLRARGGKHPLRLVAVEDGEYAALIDTRLQEEAFAETVRLGWLPWLAGCSILKRNPRVGSTVLDLMLDCQGKSTFVELKSAVMRLEEEFAAYPDAPTERGRLQIELLAELAKQGFRSIVVFIAGIPHARGFKFYCEVDREICRAVRKALEAGVEFRGVNLFMDVKGNAIVLGDADLPVDLSCCVQ